MSHVWQTTVANSNINRLAENARQRQKNTYLQEGKKVEKQGDSAQVPVRETNLVFSSHPRHQERLRSNPVRSSKAKSKSPRIHTIVPHKAETRRSNLGNASVWLFRPLTETRRGEACLGMSRPPWRRHYEVAEAEGKADTWWGGGGERTWGTVTVGAVRNEECLSRGEAKWN